MGLFTLHKHTQMFAISKTTIFDRSLISAFDGDEGENLSSH